MTAAPTEPATHVRFSPRPDQREAVGALAGAFGAGAARAQLIAPPGIGKTFEALWIAERLDARVILYFAPSLSLVAQTVLGWFAQHDPATRLEALAVCSDETVGEDIPRSDVPIPVTTDPDDVAAFLRRPVSEGERRVVFATYQSVAAVEAGLHGAGIRRGGREVDLAVCDEAHRIAGPEGKRFQIVLDADRIPVARRVFMTATPRLLAPHQRRTNEDGELLVASMDDTECFGPVAYRLSYGDAIALGLLADYRIDVLVVRDRDVRARVGPLLRAAAGVGPGGPPAGSAARALAGDADAQDIAALAQAAATVNALRDGVFRHAFSFHHTRVAALRFLDAFRTVARLTDESTPATPRASGGWVTDAVFGDWPVAARRAALGAMLGAPRGLLASVKALAEGVDAPSLDAIVFVDPKASVVDIAQIVGRALRRDAADPAKVAHIVVPLVIPDGAGYTAEAELIASVWEPVWRLVAALAAHDNRLEREFALAVRRRADRDAAREISGTPGLTAEDETALVLARPLVLSLPADVPLERFRRAVVARAIDEVGDPWEYGLGRLLAYVRTHRTARVAVDQVEPDGYALGKWAAGQRAAFRAGRLAADRAAALDRLRGWWWGTGQGEWDAGIASLRRFVRARGHARVPTIYLDRQGFWLGAWVAAQRAAHAEGSLPPFRALRLESLPGWTWRGRPMPPAPPASLDEAILEAMREIARSRPAPPPELVVPLGEGALRHLRPYDTHPLAAWTVREAMPAWLRRVGDDVRAEDLAEWEDPAAPDTRPGYDRMVARRPSWRSLRNQLESLIGRLGERVKETLAHSRRVARRTSLVHEIPWSSSLREAAKAFAWEQAWIDATPAGDPEHGVLHEARDVASYALLVLALQRVIETPAAARAHPAVARLAAMARRERSDVTSYFLPRHHGGATVRLIDREETAIRRDAALATRRYGLPAGGSLWTAVEDEMANQDVEAADRRHRRAAARLGGRRGRLARYSALGDAPNDLGSARDALRAQRRKGGLGPRDQIRVELRDWRQRERAALAARLGYYASDWSLTPAHGQPGVLTTWRGARHAQRDPDLAPTTPPNEVCLEANPHRSTVRTPKGGSKTVSHVLLTLPKRSALAVHRANRLTVATVQAREARIAAAKAARAQRIAEADAVMEAARGTPSAEMLRLAAGRVRREKIETPPPHALTDITLLLARPVAGSSEHQRFEAVWLRAGDDAPRGQAAAMERGFVDTRDGVVVRVVTAARADEAPAVRAGAEPRAWRVHPGGFTWPDLPRTEPSEGPPGPASMGSTVADAASDAADEVALYDSAHLSDGRTDGDPPLVRRGVGSPARSRMPDGTIVENRDERFAENTAALREFVAAHGHLFPTKRDRPRGINIYVFLQRMERAWRANALPVDRWEQLNQIPEWHARLRDERPNSASTAADDGSRSVAEPDATAPAAEPPRMAARPPLALVRTAESSISLATRLPASPGHGDPRTEETRPTSEPGHGGREHPYDAAAAAERRAAWKARWKAQQAEEKRVREARRLAARTAAPDALPTTSAADAVGLPPTTDTPAAP